MKNIKNIKLVVTFCTALFISVILICSYAKNIPLIGDTEEEITLPVSSSAAYTVIQSDISDEPANSHSYQTLYDFPYDDMSYANDEAFEFLKSMYKNLEFYGDFQKGDLEVYDFYKEKFAQLLNREGTLLWKNEKTGEFELTEIENWIGTAGYGPPIYYFFDIDGDGAPEIFQSHPQYYVGEIFKYLPDADQFIIWHEVRADFYLVGSLKMRWGHDGPGDNMYSCGDKYGFYLLDENGETEMCVFFYEYYGKWKTHMVGLPWYTSRDSYADIPEAVKMQGYFEEDSGLYYYKITDEQFAELTKDYFEAKILAEENIKEVTFTYSELFGEKAR